MKREVPIISKRDAGYHTIPSIPKQILESWLTFQGLPFQSIVAKEIEGKKDG